jgi:hypothetical protein
MNHYEAQMTMHKHLTPKGPYLIWRTNQFLVASLDLSLFLDFLKLFVNIRFIISFAGVQIS